MNKPIIELSSELVVAFTVEKISTLPHPPLYKILAGTLPELITLYWFSEFFFYLLEIADIPVTAQVMQQLGARVTEST